MLTHTPTQKLDQHPTRPQRSPVTQDPLREKEPKRSPPKMLCCIHCTQPITSEDARIEIDEQHTHTFTNPAGFLYRLGCFQDAQGLQQEGPPCSEATWFAGYAWQILRCAGCGIHLGWRYLGPRDIFFGLILARLILRDLD